MIKYKKINEINNKINFGFTLVELIVSLTILTLLAAILVPSLLGWIDKSNQKAMITECRTCVVSAQSLANEAYKLGKAYPTAPYSDVKELAGVSGKIVEIEYSDTSKPTITHLKYVKEGMLVTYCADCENCSTHSDTYTFEETDISDED